MARNSNNSIAYLEHIRWQGKPKCPYCGSECSTSIERRVRYHCNTCYTSYSVTVNTFFHRTHVDLQKWLKAIPLVLGSSNGISVRKLAQEVGISKNTAAFMIKRLHNATGEDLNLIRAILSDT